jgi:hypothetical protein
MEDAEPNAAATAKSYHEAMGVFIEECATTEAIMRALLCHYAKVNFVVGRIIFANTRIAQIMEMVRGLISVDLCDSHKRSLRHARST